MINKIKVQKKYYWLLVITTVMALLIFANMNNSLLWKDEAITANIGYNTLKYGYPKIWDDCNLISSTDGNSFNQLLVSSNYEWLQFYLCAISFAIFGKTTFAARFPFSIFALLSIILIWIIAERVFKNLNKVICCTMFYGLNVQFLLYSFQARYYSLVLFGIALCILAVLNAEEKIEHDKRLSWNNYFFIAVSITFSFHSSRISGFTIATAIVFYLLYRYRRSSVKLIFSVVYGSMTWVIWYLINSVLLKAPSFGTGVIETHVFTKILMILWKIQVYFFPLITLVIIYLFFELFLEKGNRKGKIESWFIFFSLIALMNILYVAIPHWGIVNHYFISILVVAPFFLTAFITYCFSHSKCIACCLTAILLFSNILNVWPYFLIKGNTYIEKNEMNNLLSENSSVTTNFGLISSPNTDGNFRIQALNDYLNSVKIRSYLWEYLYESRNGVKTYVDEVTQLLNENAKPGDTVLVLGFEYEPIVFYTDLRVVNNMTTSTLKNK